MPWSRFPMLAIALALLLTPALARADTLTVFAAASMTDALTRAEAAYRAKTGRGWRLSFASSSTLAKQIEQGAPADIFVSASESWMTYLQERDLLWPESRVALVSNALVLIAPGDAAAANAGGTVVGPDTDIVGMLGDDGRLAVGDPDHVPAGIYAKEALEMLGLWAEAEPRLARADNVRAALALVARGEAPLGIVYATDAIDQPGIVVLGRFPTDSHRPISYPAAIVRGDGAPEAARHALDWLRGAEGMAVLAEFGFVSPP